MTDVLTDNLHRVADAGPEPQIDAQAILRGGRRRRQRRRVALAGGVAMLAVAIVGSAVVVPNALQHKDNTVATLANVTPPTYRGHRVPLVQQHQPVEFGERIDHFWDGWSASVQNRADGHTDGYVGLDTAHGGPFRGPVARDRVQADQPTQVMCINLDLSSDPDHTVRTMFGYARADAAFGEVVANGRRIPLQAVRVGGEVTLYWTNTTLPYEGVAELVLGIVDPATGDVSLEKSRVRVNFLVQGQYLPMSC